MKMSIKVKIIFAHFFSLYVLEYKAMEMSLKVTKSEIICFGNNGKIRRGNTLQNVDIL